ncbi:MAG TPA: response regulator [Candidatus Limnocylindrales bacterium]|jgi:CheY-like chemotaxis protein|nr:response regulator [Candidatus Limnocylindrales bacterium]
MQLADAAILVVEDEVTLCEIMTAWLRRSARLVLSAHNGQEAFHLLQQEKIDVVISDVRMPIMDGVALLRAIRNLPPPHPAVIFITGFSDLEPRDAYGLGIEAILEKPLERDQLLKAVQRSLSSRAEIWSKPTDAIPAFPLTLTFASREQAVREKQIAFGHGGFCVSTDRSVPEGPVALRVSFRDDGMVCSGRGEVRWTAPAESLIGIELTYVDDHCREWAAEQAELHKLECFIPNSPEPESSRATVAAAAKT